jgi:hypothetical protein
VTWLLRNGAAILLVTALFIFAVSLFGGILAANEMTNQYRGQLPSSGALLLTSLVSALSNSVWAFGLACVVDRLDRHWGTRK